MVRKSIATLIVVGALTAVTALGAFTYRTVYAQQPTPTAPAGDATAPDAGSILPKFGERGPRGGFDRGGQGGQDLADALGIDLTTLQAAQKTAAEAALQQAVDQGLITQAQADQLKANGLDGRHGMLLKRAEAASIDMQALLAKALNISVDDLKAAQQKAMQTALDRAVANGQITQEQADLMKARQAVFGSDKFQSSMQSAFEAAVQQAVTDGAITQAQADQILKEQAGKNFFGGGRGGPGGFDGFGGGRHGGRGGMRGGDRDNQTPTTPDSTSPSSAGGGA